MLFIPVTAKLNFQMPLSNIQSVSHDHLEIILIFGFGAQKAYIIVISFKNRRVFLNCDHFIWIL